MNVAPAKPASKQRGVLMVALMAGIAIVLILSTVAVQKWSDITRRDDEAEMMFRAQDIVRALKRFQADRGKLPVELKEMMEPGQKNQYVLRHLWKDPLVKGGQWQLVYASPAGGLFDPSVPVAPAGGDAPLPGFSQTRVTPNDPGSPPSLGLNGPPGGGPTGNGADPTGMPIAGVKTKCKDRPFRRYKDKDEYADWVFSIFDIEPQQPAKPPTQPNQPGTPPPSGTAGFPPVPKPNK